MDIRFFNSGGQISSYQHNTYLLYLFITKASLLKLKNLWFITVVSDNQDHMGRNCFDLLGRIIVEDARGWDGKMTTKQAVKTRRDGTVGAQFLNGVGR